LGWPSIPKEEHVRVDQETLIPPDVAVQLVKYIDQQLPGKARELMEDAGLSGVLRIVPDVLYSAIGVAFAAGAVAGPSSDWFAIGISGNDPQLGQLNPYFTNIQRQSQIRGNFLATGWGFHCKAVDRTTDPNHLAAAEKYVMERLAATMVMGSDQRHWGPISQYIMRDLSLATAIGALASAAQPTFNQMVPSLGGKGYFEFPAPLDLTSADTFNVSPALMEALAGNADYDGTTVAIFCWFTGIRTERVAVGGA
jgi:hypothetical protein